MSASTSPRYFVSPVLADAPLELDAPGMSRKPPWEYDELLLALDLYLTERRVLERSDARVTAVAEKLRRLPLRRAGADTGFRTADAVVMKLANFRAIDPSTAGIGLQAGGRRDGEVWRRFAASPTELRRAVENVQSVTEQEVNAIDDEPDVVEGRLLYRRHRHRERDPRVATKKRADHLRRNGRLSCELCGLEPQRSYGPLGAAVLECHHLRPLTDGERVTRLADLMVVCANCHRLIHAQSPWPPAEALKLGLSALVAD